MDVNKLQDLLSQQCSLFMTAQMAHWNVTGPCFSELHGLFQDVYEMAHGQFDDTAELLRQQREKVLPPSVSVTPLIETDGMVNELLAQVESISGFITSVLAPTLDLAGQTLLGDQAVALNKMAWKLRSTIELLGSPQPSKRGGYAYKG